MQIPLSRSRTLAAAILAATLSGCSFTTSIHYEAASTAPVAATARVALQVVNNRPPKHGGQSARVGRVRGGYGNPFPVSEADPAGIERSVRDAVTDALSRTGIAVEDAAAPVLVASLEEYWLDGFGACSANVSIEYSLRDARGSLLWQGSAAAGGGNTVSYMVFQADEIARSAFQIALDGVVVQSVKAFGSEDFRRHLGKTGA